MQFFPAILSDSETVVQQQLDWAAHSNSVDVVQLDIIDGIMADNITVAPLDLSLLEFHDLKCDLHLMVEEPMDYVFEAEAVKQRLPVRTVIAQVERMSYQQSFLDEVRQQNWKTGLSLDLFTPLEALEPGVWEHLDVLQLMGNELGTQGQPLHAHLWEKVAEARAFITKYGYTTQLFVDIGVNLETAPKLWQAGVEGVAVGSAIWNSSEPMQTMQEFAKLASTHEDKS